MFLKHAQGVLLALSLGCSQPIALDAGGIRDAGQDGGRDGGRDAAQPDAMVDAAGDGGIDPPEGWVPLPGLPEYCRVERAVQPELVVPPSTWEPCPEQPDGCRRARVRWLPTDQGWYDQATGHGYVVAYGNDMAIVDLDRGGIAAWRAPPFVTGDPGVCGVQPVAMGEGFAAVYVWYRSARAEHLNMDRVYHARLEEIGDATEPMTVISPGLVSTPQALAVTRTHVFAEMQPVAVVLGFTEGRWGPVWSEAVDGGIPQRVRAVGDVAYWLHFAGAPRIAYGTLDRPAAFLRDARPDRIRGFETDGVDLTWVEIGDSPPSLELWTAPVVSDAADLRPRLVRDVVGVQFIGVGGGWHVLMKADPERLELTELATGRTKTWLAPDGYRITATGDNPNYVTATEIVFDAFTPDGAFWLRVDPRTIPWDE